MKNVCKLQHLVRFSMLCTHSHTHTHSHIYTVLHHLPSSSSSAGVVNVAPTMKLSHRNRLRIFISLWILWLNKVFWNIVLTNSHTLKSQCDCNVVESKMVLIGFDYFQFGKNFARFDSLSLSMYKFLTISYWLPLRLCVLVCVYMRYSFAVHVPVLVCAFSRTLIFACMFVRYQQPYKCNSHLIPMQFSVIKLYCWINIQFTWKRL